ncbi:hypothetical protein D6783_03475 [Candidatus Woesearchaeota archaeon]|nr:MAG: hypothetical protein D6783_03475 [Candidatus Woesearchaeota archaeon]
MAWQGALGGLHVATKSNAARGAGFLLVLCMAVLSLVVLSSCTAWEALKEKSSFQEVWNSSEEFVQDIRNGSESVVAFLNGTKKVNQSEARSLALEAWTAQFLQVQSLLRELGAPLRYSKQEVVESAVVVREEQSVGGYCFTIRTVLDVERFERNRFTKFPKSAWVGVDGGVRTFTGVSCKNS